MRIGFFALGCGLLLVVVDYVRRKTSKDKLMDQLRELSEENGQLKDTVAQHRSSMRKLECQMRQVNKKKLALLETIKILKRDLWSEKQARFVVEHTLSERLKNVEMELDFKETELEELKHKHSVANNQSKECGEDEAWLYDFPSSSRSCSSELDSLVDFDDSEDLSNDACSISETTNGPFMEEARHHAYHHFICNVSAASINVDLDDLVVKHMASADDCVLATFGALLDYIEHKGQAQSLSKYSKVLLHFMDETFDRQSLFQSLVEWTHADSKRLDLFMSILMNLYKEEILDVDDILAWHAAIQHQDDMKKIVSKCKPFIDWIQSEVESSSETSSTSSQISSDEAPITPLRELMEHKPQAASKTKKKVSFQEQPIHPANTSAQDLRLESLAEV